MNQQQMQARQVAYIVNIRDILAGKFIKEDGWEPNYVIVGDKHVARVNIIATVIDNDDSENVQNITIDDGTGKISLRNFESKLDVSVGDVILLIARIREYGNQRYLTPEIAKKNTNSRWSIVWKANAIKNDVVSNIAENKGIEEIKINIAKDKPKIIEQKTTKTEDVFSEIKSYDSGDGVDYEKVAKIVGGEKMLQNMLMQGELFEIKPGKIKVLE